MVAPGSDANTELINSMKTRCQRLALLTLFWLALVPTARPQETTHPTPAEIFQGTLDRLVNIVQPSAGGAPELFSARVELVKAGGLPQGLLGRSVKLACQAPDQLSVSADIDGKQFSAGRNGQQIWIYAPAKKFGVIGKPGVARFASAPDQKDTTHLADFKLPLPPEQLALLPLLMDVRGLPAANVETTLCYALRVTPKPEAIQALKLPRGELTLWVRQSDFLPLRIGYRDGKKLDVELQLHDAQLRQPAPADTWDIPSQADDHIETTALSHLTRFFPVALSLLDQKIPTLGPATGERRVVATEGKGRLELIDGTRVLFLKGTPEEMGAQQGKLLKKQIRKVVNCILYGVGVGSSFEKGRWFFGEIEEAQNRLASFIEPRYLREMDAIALASGFEREEIRLANFFPELFHCSGFARVRRRDCRRASVSWPHSGLFARRGFRTKRRGDGDPARSGQCVGQHQLRGLYRLGDRHERETRGHR